MRLKATSVLWIAIISVVGIAGQWLGYPLEHLWRWFAGLFIIGLLIEYVSSRAIKISARLLQPNQAYLGRSTSYQLVLHNQSRQQINLRFAPLSPTAFEGATPQAHAKIASDAKERLDFQQTPQALGEHPWPPQPVELHGILHLAYWIRRLPLADETNGGNTGEVAATIVEPDHLEHAAHRAALDRQGPRTTRQATMGGQEFRGLRAYLPGDAPASIDWKSTARSGSLRVRETEAEQQLTIYFVLDCGRGSGLHTGGMATLSHATNVIARMAEHAQHSGDRFGLMSFAQEPLAQLRAGRGAIHLRKLRGLLTQSETVNAVSNPLSAIASLATLLPQRALILLFTSLDDAEAAGQLAQATHLLRPQHLPMIVSIEDKTIREAARARAIDKDDVFVGIAAREHLRTAAHTRAQVERLGAIVIEAAPNKIEAVAFERLRRLRASYSV